MPMASDQRRKRINGASMVSYGSPEQHRTKRKNFGLVQSDINMKSHIAVEWDGNHQMVVAKREQIGISWRQMRPFTNFAHHGHKVLADVLAIPQEIFSLDSLKEVLSYEVWNTQLLDNERNLLMQFLPSALEPHQVVRELLSGDNFHFGNPFMKWAASLCSGDLHPDMIVNLEQHLISDKRAYYSELHNYHMDMIAFLIKLKQGWESCTDPEKEILPKIQRSKNDIEKRRQSNLNGFRVDDLDENMTVASESSSWGAEDKAYSDNQISSLGQCNELQRRVLDTDVNKGNPKKLRVSSDFIFNVGTRPNEGGKVNKLNIHASDGDKYMSYIKVSKKQHELVKSLKLSCKSIQASTLDHVLGGPDNIHAQPYGLFIKEEQKKFHDLWLQLVNNDLPAAYANWTERLTLTHKMRKSLLLDIKEKSNVLVKGEDVVSRRIQAQDQEDGGVNNQSSSEEDEDSITTLPENLSLQNSYHSSDDELHHLSIDLEKNNLSKGVDSSWSKTEHSRIRNSQDDPIREGAPFSSDGHTQRAVETSHAYYDSAGTHDYTTTGVLPVNPLTNEDKQTQIFGPESDLQQEDTGKELLHRQSDDGQFGSYQCQDQTDFIQSLIKGKGVNSYRHEQNMAGLNFRGSNNVIVGSGQFSSQFKEPGQTSLTLDQVQRQTSEVYVPESMSGNIYSHEGRYLMPGQDPLSAGNITDWAVKARLAVAPSQSHVNTGGFIGQHWFSSDHQVQGAWNGSNNGSVSDDKQTQSFGPESDLQREDTGKELLHRQSDDGQFGSYQSQDQTDFIQSLIKEKGVNSYRHEQNMAGLNFQGSNDVTVGSGQFSSQFKEPGQTSLTLDQVQRQTSEVYVPESMSGNIYSHEGRYLMPGRDPLSAGNITDWAVNAPRAVAPSQSHVKTGGFIGQHWFSSDHQVQGAWNGSSNGSVSSQRIGTVGNSNQSLITVLSHCSQLRSGPYESIRHADQFLAPRTYGVADADTHRVNDVVPSSHPLDYLSGCDAPSTLVPDDTTWMSLPPQNPSLNDRIGKSYMRSWNR